MIATTGPSEALAAQLRKAALRMDLAGGAEAEATPPAVLPSRAPPEEAFRWDQGGGKDFDQRTVNSELPA